MPAGRLREVRGTKLGMVYQDPATALNPSIRVGDQMAEVFRFHFGISKRDALERARGALERVAMPAPGDALRRYPFQLSGGQQQRVVIAMALSGDPRLLVLDEPTTGLDATVEAEVLDLIEDLRTRIDAAILLISHNLGMVARMCERVGVMYAGPDRRRGPGPRPVHRPAPPLHHGPAALRAALRRPQGHLDARAHPRLSAAPRRAAARLRVRAALRARATRVSRARARPVPLAGTDARSGAARPRHTRGRRRLVAPRALLLRRARAGHERGGRAAAAAEVVGEGEDTPEEVRETLAAVRGGARGRCRGRRARRRAGGPPSTPSTWSRSSRTAANG